jgi:PAS domain S-box-containing protein
VKGGKSQAGDPYRLLFENVGHMVCTLDLEGRFVSVNAAGVALTGYTEAELVGRSALDLIEPELRRDAAKRFERRLESGGDIPPDESILVTRDGRRVPVEVTSALIKDAAGKPSGVLGLVRDVSDRKRDEEILLESEERFLNAFENAPIGMALVALDGSWLQVNRSICEIVGYTHDELLGGATFQDITHSDDLEADLEYVRRMIAGEIETYQMEKRYLHKLGHIVWVLLSVSLVRSGDGSPLYFISQIQDITERKRAHEALERSKAQLAEAQEIAQLASWERAGDGSITWSNEVYRTFGLDPDAGPPTELELMEYVHPDDRESVLAAMQQARASLEPLSIEFRIIRSDGDIRWIQSRGKTVLVDGQEMRRVTAQDITERKEAEAERDRLREDLHHAQKLEAVGRLAGGVAHDFNNMLTAIKGYSELLVGALDRDDPLRSHAAQIRRAAEQASALPRQLLAFSRKQTLEPELVDLGEVVRNTTDLLRRLISETISLHTDVADHVLACVDASQLEQVLINLALNARDAMPDGGTLTIATETVEVATAVAAEHDVEPGPYSVITVIDTGHGMDAETKDRVFEPFFTTKAVGQGSGLGLASVYGTVSQSGGFIRLDSRPGEGARFEIFLPSVTQEHVPEDAYDPAVPAVLLAEDEEIVRDLAVSVLENAGFTVHSVANGSDAVALFEREGRSIDVVVTDMVMPEMGGRAVADRILEQAPDTPIVYMSGYTDETPDPQSGSSFLQKPFSAESLVEAVRGAIPQEVIDPIGVTCVIADDHPAVLDAISHFLESHGVQIVARATTGEQAVQAIRHHRPAVALLDVRMQGLSGVEVVRRALGDSPETRSIIYTGHEDRGLAGLVLDAGACGFVLKDAPLTELARAVAVVAQGGIYADADATDLLAPAATETRALTPREQEVLGHLADGKTNDKVAQELGISPETVQSHVRNAMGKLGADTRTEAVATALRQSLIA